MDANVSRPAGLAHYLQAVVTSVVATVLAWLAAATGTGRRRTRQPPPTTTAVAPRTTPSARYNIDALRDALAHATSYDEWKATAQQLDRVLGNDRWKESPVSADYDHKLIHYRLAKLRSDRRAGDVINMIYSLRSGLLRNLGGISDPRLYCTSYIGTKRLIQEYTREVVSILDQLASTDHPDLPPPMRLDFFHETKQSFGCSALILEGGATFGLYHMGVVRALHEQKMLPNVISGSAVGALIAALVCIHTDAELEVVFRTGGIDLSAFDQVGAQGNLRRKLVRWFKTGHALNIKVLENCVRSNVGDLTFEEAFKKTHRILNITVAADRPHDTPQVLNYLTAPNVLIWSAACVSTAATYPLYEHNYLYAKDNDGRISKWSPNDRDVAWSAADGAATPPPPLRRRTGTAGEGAAAAGTSPLLGRVTPTPAAASTTRTTSVPAPAVVPPPDPSSESSPHHRLVELFNVNHLIVSQAGALAAPMVLRGWRKRHSFLARVLSAVLMEVRHRTAQAAYLGLIPPLVAQWVAPPTITGDVTITPDLSLDDYRSLFANPTAAAMDYWVRKGMRSTWPLISLIKNRCVIEFALDRNYRRLRDAMAARARRRSLVDSAAPRVAAAPVPAAKAKKRHQPGGNATDPAKMPRNRSIV
ncbi:triacylglycerol lipase [Blastocladiella emersonii ATCC 22665]|nr:triacylglycerol lipase [Blastocladiella emersonii ATCC 22665]